MDVTNTSILDSKKNSAHMLKATRIMEDHFIDIWKNLTTFQIKNGKWHIVTDIKVGTSDFIRLFLDVTETSAVGLVYYQSSILR